MKKFCVLLLVLCYLIVIVPLQSSAVEVEETVETTSNTVVQDILIRNGSKSLDAGQALLGNEQLTDNALSVILYETNSQTLMHEWNADEPTDPASLVKIMTGLIVAERGTLTDAVTITEEFLSGVPGYAATAELQVDEVLTVEQLLYCMLVASANDAAAVLAHYIAGSEEAFVEIMNEYAAELGCTNTHFTNVHGLYDENQYSTARDIARILDQAMKNEVFRQAFGTVHYTIPATNKSDVRYSSTGNYLMSTSDVLVYFDGRVVGGRTGVTEAGYRNLATIAQSGNMELMCILLGAESEYTEKGYVLIFGGYRETSDLLNKGFDGMQLTQVVRKDQVLTQKSVINGECDVVLAPVDEVFAVLPTSVKITDLSYRYTEENALEAPISKGDLISNVEIWYNNICVAKTQLCAMNSVDIIHEQSAEEQSETFDGSVLWIILAVILSVVVLFSILRVISGMVRRRRSNRSRQYRRNRRRSR